MMDAAEGEERTAKLLTARVLSSNFASIHVSSGCSQSNDRHLVNFVVVNFPGMSDAYVRVRVL